LIILTIGICGLAQLEVCRIILKIKDTFGYIKNIYCVW